MVLPAFVTGALSGGGAAFGGNLVNSIFGSSQPTPQEMLKAFSNQIMRMARENVAAINKQTDGVNAESEAFKNNYVSDQTRGWFGNKAWDWAKDLTSDAAGGRISFAEAANKFNNSAMEAGIRPGDTMKGGMSLAAYGRAFDEAERKAAPMLWNTAMNTNAMQILGRSLTKEEQDIYKIGSMTDSQAKALMANTWEGVNNNFGSHADAEAADLYGGRTVYPTWASRFNQKENDKQRIAINRGLTQSPSKSQKA
jgi:hypothetical protein